MTERALNAYFLFHYYQYICSSLGDLLRFFAVSVAVFLAVADLLTTIQRRWLRFPAVLAFLLFAGGMQVTRNAWPMLGPGAWAIFFGILVLLFLVGHGVMAALLRWVTRGKHFPWWHQAFCLVIGLGPIMVLGGLGFFLDHSRQLQSTQELMRVLIVLGGAISLPYFVFYCFALLAAKNPVYGQRLAQGFGLTGYRSSISQPP